MKRHRTGAYDTAKETFFHDFPSKSAVRIVQVCVLYSNFGGMLYLSRFQLL